MTREMALLIDLTLCEGCGACAEACREEHNLPETDAQDLSSRAYTAVVERSDLYVKKMCMHCRKPTCASVCPVGAFEKTPGGPVIYHYERCMGCRYCMQACPFSIPTYEWDNTKPRVQKCNMCIARQNVRSQPACAEICPAEATIYGERKELLEIAHRRISDNPDKYVDHVFGEFEVGGTSVLYISSEPFSKLGFPSNLPGTPLPDLTWEVLSKIPRFSVFAGAFFYGVWWIIDRRMEMEEKQNNSTTASTVERRP